MKMKNHSLKHKTRSNFRRPGAIGAVCSMKPVFVQAILQRSTMGMIDFRCGWQQPLTYLVYLYISE